MITKNHFIPIFLFCILLFLFNCASETNQRKAFITPKVNSFRNKIVFYAPYEHIRYNGKWNNTEKDFIKQHNEILKSNPELDAEYSISNNNFHFIGLSGVGFIIPGLQNKEENKLFEKYGFIVICGTSDSINDISLPLEIVAQDYALRYNRYLIKRLLEKK